MLGFSELWLPALIILAIAIWGSKGFLKMYRDWKQTRVEMKKVDKEFEETAKEIKMEAR